MIVLYLLGMTMFGALGGLMLKKVSAGAQLSSKLLFFLFGCFLYGLSSVLNILALRHAPYTVVFPLTSITYIWTFLLSYFYLKERLNRYKIMGLLFILLGAIIIAD